MSSNPSDPQAILQRLVKDFLGVLPKEVQRAVHLGVISHAFTPRLLQEMVGKEVNISEILERLRQYHFIRESEGNWYAFETNVRKILITFWQRQENRAEFYRANEVSYAFFSALATQSSPPGTYVYQREVLYHQLQHHEASGLNLLAELFEQACDQQMLGIAQSYLPSLQELLPSLSDEAVYHYSYYQSRLAFLDNRPSGLETTLTDIINKSSDQLIKARAGVLLGQLWSSQYEWKNAANILKSSLHQFNQMKAERFAGRTMLALGNIYIDLAKYSGGWHTDFPENLGKFSRFLHTFLLFPFLILDWLRRKISFLPGWVYFSGNYQDWILNYLLQQGQVWFRRAKKIGHKIADENMVLDSMSAQAVAALHQRREARARQIYSQISLHSMAFSSRYRSAEVLSGQGQISMLAGNLSKACDELQGALETFRDFEDEIRIARTAQRLGEVFLKRKEYESATELFLESIRAFRLTYDPLSETQIALQLEELARSKKLVPVLEQKVLGELKDIQEHHYLARFPSQLLLRFRALAYLVTLPLSYIVIIFIGIAVGFSLMLLETINWHLSGIVTPIDLFSLAAITLLPIPLVIWTIELVYCLVGQVGLFVMASESLNSLAEQPDRIVVNSDSLTILRSRLGNNLELIHPWNNIEVLSTADYKLWLRPISLFSRQVLASEGQAIIVEGITSGYSRLTQEIKERIASTAKYLNVDMLILANRWTYLTLLVATLHAWYLIDLGQIKGVATNSITGEQKILFWHVLFISVLLDWLIVFPPILLWRIFLHNKLLARISKYRLSGTSAVLIPILAALLTLVAIAWLIISPAFKIG